jgi:ATP-dependent RNA helicase DDX19/DBP5
VIVIVIGVIVQVTLTINYDIPTDESGEPDPLTYLHRSGRTARFGRKGITLNLVDGPKSMNDLDRISKHWGRPIDELTQTNLEDVLEEELTKLEKARK